MEASKTDKPLTAEGGATKPVTAYSWYIVGVLVLMNIFSWLDRQVIVMLMDPIKQDLGITEVQISLLTGFAFALLYAICGIPFGIAADKFSRRMVIFCGVCFWSISTMLCGFARSFGSLFVARVGVGVGEAALIPSSYSILSDTFPPQRMGLASAFLASASAVGIGMSFTIAGLIASSVSHGEMVNVPLIGEMRAWQVAFLVVGAPGPFLALLIFTFKEPKRGGTLSKTIAAVPGKAEPGFFSYMKEYWQFYFFHIGAMTCANVGHFALVTWAPAYLTRVYEWSPLEVGAIFGVILGLGILIGQVLGGTFADYFYGRGMKDAHLRIYAFAALLTLPVYAGSILAGNPYVFLAGVIMVMIIMLGNSAAGLAAMQFMTPNEYRGRILGIHMFVANFFGMGVGPTAVAVFTQYLFKDDKAVGNSLILVALFIYPLTAWMFWMGAKYMRLIHEKRGI